MPKTKQIITIEHTLKEVLKNLSDEDILNITGKSKSKFHYYRPRRSTKIN